PFPDVSRHVEKAIHIWGELGYRRYSCVTVERGVANGKLALVDIGHPFPAGIELAPPGIGLLFQAAARGEFPFGLGGEAFAGPLGVSRGVVPGDLDYRIIAAPT